MKSWLQDNNTEMYSIQIEAKSVVAERPIRTLKNKLYKYMTSNAKNAYIDKYMTSNAKNAYIDKLDDIVKKNTTMHIIKPLK